LCIRSIDSRCTTISYRRGGSCCTVRPRGISVVSRGGRTA
jgi:hypothetical protein